MLIRKLLIALITLAPLALSAQDKTYKHASQYQIAILDQNVSVYTGNDQTLARSQTDAKLGLVGQNIHILHTDSGDYRIEAPVNKGMSVMSVLAAGMVDRPYAAQTIHNKWFLDNVQQGTRVLFAASCSEPNRKHPSETVRCKYWLPDPDSTTHESETVGDFTPRIAGDGSNAQKTANALCGTGKLNPATESQLCNHAKASVVPGQQ